MTETKNNVTHGNQKQHKQFKNHRQEHQEKTLHKLFVTGHVELSFGLRV